MAYCNSPYAPRTRRGAVALVVPKGLPVSEATRRTGVHQTTPHRWIQKAQDLELAWNTHVPTLSSAPHRPSNTLP